MSKRTHSSVTETPCECGYLENAANDPDGPIVFDEETSEYQFQYDEQRSNRFQHLAQAIKGTNPCYAMLIIYHCPFCGGAAPESKRHLLFEIIPREEESRLASLLDGIKTIEAAIEKFGPPDMDSQSATKTPEGDNDPPKIEHHRHIRYYNLSNVAYVCLDERNDGTAYWQLLGKPKDRHRGR